MRYLARLLLLAVLLPLSSVVTLAGDTSLVFAGCDEQQAVPEESAASEAAAAPAKPALDPFSKRAFASFSINDLEAGVAEDLSSLCWARLDGVWREEGRVSFDSDAVDATIWGVDDSKLLPLSSGRYTQLKHLVIVEPKDPATALYLASGLDAEPFVKFVSNDGIAMADVMQRNGKTKTYQAMGNFKFGSRLRVKVTATGRVGLYLGGTDFYRPAPNNTLQAMQEQPSAETAWLMGSTLEFLAAARRGYDVLMQDPFYLDNNKKLEVFAELDSQKYYVEEKRLVPVNYHYMPEAVQGMIYRKSLISSARQVQETSSHSLGLSYDASKLGPKAALSATQSSMRSMSESNTAGRAVGYSRSKKYALVADYPYMQLSDTFLDSVQEALENHRYQALIDKFGTHYPYAVTYGATAQMTQTIDRETYAQRIAESSSYAASGGYGGLSASLSTSMSSMQGESGSLSKEKIAFVAVGGNGSWNQDGYMAGEPHYPILLHLRPLWELLNPMYFPGQPQIYQTARGRLERAIERYGDAVEARLGPITEESLAADIKPAKAEPVETWYVYVKRFWCTGKGVGKVKYAEAKMRISGELGGEETGSTREKSMKLKCKKNYDTDVYTYDSGDPQRLVITGTRAEMKRYRALFDLTWKYTGTVKSQSWRDTEKDPYGSSDHPFATGLGVGKYKSYTWKVSEDKYPTLHFQLRFYRGK